MLIKQTPAGYFLTGDFVYHSENIFGRLLFVKNGDTCSANIINLDIFNKSRGCCFASLILNLEAAVL
jgi:hypothetical protein